MQGHCPAKWEKKIVLPLEENNLNQTLMVKEHQNTSEKKSRFYTKKEQNDSAFHTIEKLL